MQKIELLFGHDFENDCLSVLKSALLSSPFGDIAGLPERLSIMSQFSMQNRFRYVARMDGKIVGFADWKANELSWLAVRAEYQSHGVGSSLLQAVRNRIDGKCSLLCFEKNRRALQFYMKHGFEICENGVEGKMFGFSLLNFRLLQSLDLQPAPPSRGLNSP